MALPEWLIESSNGFVVDPDKVKSIVKIFELARTNHSWDMIQSELTTLKLATLNGKESWTTGAIKKVLTNKAVTGDDNVYKYPQIVTQQVFDDVKILLATKMPGRTGGSNPNLFKSLATCECKAKMSYRNLANMATPKRLVCDVCGQNVPYEAVETVVLDTILKWACLNRNLDPITDSEIELQQEEAVLQEKLNEASARAARLKVVPISLQQEISRLQTDISAVKTKVPKPIWRKRYFEIQEEFEKLTVIDQYAENLIWEAGNEHKKNKVASLKAAPQHAHNPPLYLKERLRKQAECELLLDSMVLLKERQTEHLNNKAVEYGFIEIKGKIVDTYLEVFSPPNDGMSLRLKYRL